MSDDLQAAKATVHRLLASLDEAGPGDFASVLGQHVSDDYRWRGVEPFGEQSGADAVAATFWEPLSAAFAPLQRRPDVFLAGRNDADGGESVWVAQMGHQLGLFDRPWLAIPPTGRMAFVRYAEFHRVEGDVVAESAVFVDVISLMRQAGHYPLPPASGSAHVYPGPRTHAGILDSPQDPHEGAATLALVNRMVQDLSDANEHANATGDDRVPREVLAKCWHDDMIWSGPDGIGATYTIDRYQQQHQHPFRMGLTGKRFNGHVARFAEGEFACFFGWPNLTNRPSGGFLGLPASTAADMRVVDVYRRDGDKLAENWVFIDLVHWLRQQGLDVLGRMRQLTGQEDH